MVQKTEKQKEALAAAKRRDAVRRLVTKGYTFTEIADELGISRQRAHQLFLGPVSQRRPLP